MDIKEILGVLTTVFICNWGVATILFGRISLRYLDRSLEMRGISAPLWDGIGIRLNLYSFALISSWFAKSSLVPGEIIRQVARPRDGYLALFYNVSAWLCFISAITFYFF